MSKMPTIVLPTDCFRRIESSLQVTAATQTMAEKTVKMSSGIWLLNSPTTGFASPMNSSNPTRAKRPWPGMKINGQYFTWVGMQVPMKCLVSFPILASDNEIPIATDAEIVAMQRGLIAESHEVRRLYSDCFDLDKLGIWRTFRESKGNENDIELRDWLSTQEMSFMVFGHQVGIGSKNIQRRQRYVRETADELGYSQKRDTQYKINPATIKSMREACKDYDSYLG